MTAAVDPILTAARRCEARARAELALLAAIAPLGRWGIALAGRAGITADHFDEDDTRAIFCALVVAHEPRRCESPASRNLRAARLARWALNELGHWDESDTRSFPHGSRWGPASLGRLFCGLTPAAAEMELPGRAAALLALAGERKVA